jgi:hypothetical protein
MMPARPVRRKGRSRPGLARTRHSRAARCPPACLGVRPYQWPSCVLPAPGQDVAAGRDAAHRAGDHAAEGEQRDVARGPEAHTETGDQGLVRLLRARDLGADPGAFRTALFDAGRAGVSADSGVYARVGETRGFVAGGDGAQPGDPAKAAALILAALNAERTPLRLPLGEDSVTTILGHLDQVRDDIAAWEKRTRATAFGD